MDYRIAGALLCSATLSLFLLSPATAATHPADQSQAPEVAVGEVRAEPLHLSRAYSGRLKAHQTVNIRPEVTGRVVERHFEEGARVSAGDLLFRLDPRTYEARLATAEANVERARAALEAAVSRADRYGKLVNRQAISEQDHELAQAELKSAQANLLMAEAEVLVAELDLERTALRSPASGLVGEALVDEGNLVTANQAAVMAVVNVIDPIEIEMSIPSDHLYEMTAGTLEFTADNYVTVTLQDGTEPEDRGRLVFVDNQVDIETDTVKVKALFPNQDGRMLPGHFIRASLHYGVAEEAILVPQRAVTHDPEGKAIMWLLDENRVVTPTPVSISGTHGNRWIVSDGLSEGTLYVMEGFQKIQPGSEVIPVPFEAP